MTRSYPELPSLALLSKPPVASASATVGKDGGEETGDGAEDGDSPRASTCRPLDGLEPHNLTNRTLQRAHTCLAGALCDDRK